MSTQTLINELKTRGIVLTARGGRLHYRAPGGTLTVELRERIAGNKAALLAELGTGHAEPLEALEAAWRWLQAREPGHGPEYDRHFAEFIELLASYEAAYV